MKLSTIGVTHSQLRHLAESILDAPTPRPNQHTFSYHILCSAIDLDILSEGVLGNMMAQLRASSRPIPNVDNILWITAPDINANTAQVTELAKQAGNLPGSILDNDPDAVDWWNTLYQLFGATAADRQRVRARMEVEAQAQPPQGATAGDATAGDAVATGGQPVAKGGMLDAATKQMLADIVRQHKDTGDAVSALIKDMRADLARKNPKGAMQHAQEILQQDQAEQQAGPATGRKQRPRRAAAGPGTGKKRSKDGPITKRTPEPPKPNLWGEDYLLAHALVQERFLANCRPILEHTCRRLITGGVPVLATAASKRLYREMVEGSVTARVDPLRYRLFREEGLGSKLWSGVKSAASGAMDRWQNPAGAAARDGRKRQRIENILLAKSAIALLAQITADKLERLPGARGADLMSGEHTDELRMTARKALGIRAAADPDQFGTYTATT